MNKKLKNVGVNDPVCPKTQRGITLVALVITIIVLLILAGVSINLISGTNGILGRATKAVSESQKASIKEELELKVAEKMMAYYMGEEDKDVQTYLKEELDGESIVNGQYTVFPTIEDGNLVLSISDRDDNTVIGVVLDDNGSVTDVLEADETGTLVETNPPKITRVSSTTKSITVKITSISKVTAYACTDTNTVTDGDWVTIDTPKQTVEVTVGNKTSGQTYYFWARNGSDIETTTPVAYKAENFEAIADRTVTWNGTSATVTVASLPKNGTLQYQLDGTSGSWIDFPTIGEIIVVTGHTVYFVISDGQQISGSASTPVFKDFTVSYNANLGTGSVPDDQTVTHTQNAQVSFSPQPTRTGYTFAGWSTNQYSNSAEYTSEGTTTFVMPGEDVELFAVWNPKSGIQYTVVHEKMDLNGTTYTEDFRQNFTGTTGESITPAVKTDYEGFTAPSTQTTTIAGDGSTVVTYQYTRNQYTYTLGTATGADTTGSSPTGTSQVYYGATITLRGAASSGYEWTRWTGSDSSFTTTDANTTITMPASSLTMTPVVERLYTVTYNTYGAKETVTNATNKKSGQTVTLPTVTKDNYVFQGWYTAQTGGTKAGNGGASYTVTGDVTLHAHWSPTIASQISNTQYGMETNYQVTVNGVRLGDKTADVTDADASLDVWKVFYKDNSDNVYLIYGDYLPAKCVPQAALNAGLQKYTTDNTKPYAIYGVGEYDSTDSGQNSHNEAIRDAMVSALGTASNWSTFGGTKQGKTITATGAPTIEQFQASYGTLDLSSGYASGLDNTNTLYFPHSSATQNCYGYWLASPRPGYVDRAWFVDFGGIVRNGRFTYAYLSARPVVCLPSGISGTITGTTLNIDAN